MVLDRSISPGSIGTSPDPNPPGKTTLRINGTTGSTGKENTAQELMKVGLEDTGAWIRKDPVLPQGVRLQDHEQEQEQEQNQQHLPAPGCHHQGGFQPQEGDKTPPAPQQSNAGHCTDP